MLERRKQRSAHTGALPCAQCLPIGQKRGGACMHVLCLLYAEVVGGRLLATGNLPALRVMTRHALANPRPALTHVSSACFPELTGDGAKGLKARTAT